MSKKTTKKALFSSVVALILCFSMLVGTTFAWFTDEVESGLNTIVAGNLDVELYHENTKDEYAKVTKDTVLFDEVNPQLWEPGAVAFENLTVTNEGTLALKYQLSINFENATVVNGHSLAEALQVGIVEGGIQGTTRDAVLAEVKTWQPLATFALPGELEAGDKATYGIVIWWEPTENDNWFNMNNGNQGKILSIDLGVKLVATQLANEEDSFDKYYDGATTWYGAVDTSWYNTSDTEFVIGTAEELAGLAQLVNDGTDSFIGKTIKLASDINLNNLPWTPIGNWDNTFEGTFDGNGHTIYNLSINNPKGEGVGFFGVTQKATIKGITLENVNISAYSMVAGLVGAAYPANISDCHIAGDVEIVSEWAYVAGIAGYCYYGTQVDGCSVIAEDAGLIQSETRNAVGGITAWLLEGDHKVTNCQVKNLNLVGWTNVGGITGFVHYNNTIEGCSVENVTLTKTRADGNPGIGLIAGGWSYSASNAITLRSNTVKNATLEGTHIAYAAFNELYGSEYGGAITTNFVLENNTTANITNNLVEVTKISDGLIKTPDGEYQVYNANGLGTALSTVAAAGAGDNTVVLSCDIDLTGTTWTSISVDGYNGAGIITIEGNGATIKGLTAPLFAGGFAGKSGIVIKNLTIADSNIVSNSGLGGGAFVDTADSMQVVTLENCHLVNSTVSGERAGGLIGWVSGYANENDGPVKTYVTITNCSVVDSTVIGNGSTGGIAGHPGASDYTYTTIENCTVENVDVISYEPIDSWRTGAIVGTANNGHVVIKNVTVEDVTLTQDGVTSEEIKLYGRFVPSGTGTLTIDGAQVKSASSQDELNSTVASGNVAVTLAAGNYTMPGSNGNVTISGTKDTVITVTGITGGSNVTFNGVTVKGSGTYTGMNTTTATYNNATIVGEMCLYGEKVVFNNCTFELNGQYIWTYGAKEVEFNNCTFNTTGKAILIYNEGAGASKVTVKGCTFNATAGAKAGAIANQNCAAIEIDNFQSSGTGAAHVLITEGNTYSDNFSGEWRIKNFVAGNAVTVNGAEYTQIAIDGKMMTIDASKNVTVLN